MESGNFKTTKSSRGSMPRHAGRPTQEDLHRILTEPHRPWWFLHLASLRVPASPPRVTAPFNQRADLANRVGNILKAALKKGLLPSKQPFEEILPLFLEVSWRCGAFQQPFDRFPRLFLSLLLYLPCQSFRIQGIRRSLHGAADL